MKEKRNIIIILSLMILLIVVGAVVYYTMLQQPEEGPKTITVNIFHLNDVNKTITLYTDSLYLRDALEKDYLIDGYETEHGLWLTTVDGEKADESLEQWWGYAVNGKLSEHGIDEQIIKDGDVFNFTLNVGYEGQD